MEACWYVCFWCWCSFKLLFVILQSLTILTKKFANTMCEKKYRIITIYAIFYTLLSNKRKKFKKKKQQQQQQWEEMFTLSRVLTFCIKSFLSGSARSPWLPSVRNWTCSRDNSSPWRKAWLDYKKSRSQLSSRTHVNRGIFCRFTCVCIPSQYTLPQDF